MLSILPNPVVPYLPWCASYERKALAERLGWTSAPTISFQPISGDEFTKRLLAPMSPVTILMLIQAGWPIELVLPTRVRSVNGLHSAFRNAKADPDFAQMVQLLAELQEAQALAFHVRSTKEGGGAVLRFQRT